MNEVKTMSYSEMLAEHEMRKAAACAKAEGAPYETLFRTVVEMPDTGGGSACLSLLLSLYNGRRFKFDLTDLRRLDFGLHAAAIAVLKDEVGLANYVHERIAHETGFPAEAIQAKLEWLAYEFGIAGKAKKDQLPQRPGGFDFSSAEI